MTVNVAVVTPDALVFACDSIASMSAPFINPQGIQFTQRPDGKLEAVFDKSQVHAVIVDTTSNLQKMFSLREGPTPVAAIFTGLVVLGGVPMTTLITEFRAQTTGQQADTVETVATLFLQFMRLKYNATLPNFSPFVFVPALSFFVGGFDANSFHPTLYLVDVAKGTVTERVKAGSSDVAWQGQSDAVEGAMIGYHQELRATVESGIQAAVQAYSAAVSQQVVDFIQKILTGAGVSLKEPMTLQLPSLQAGAIPWDIFSPRIPVATMPVQDAIDLAGFLVDIQSGRARFGLGVPTVGGRTHIGVVQKEGGFRPINEPVLHHTAKGSQ